MTLSSISSSSPILSIGKQALLQESKALNRLANELSDTFEAVVLLLSRIEGKVVFSGVGKSGYIARKIASTFSSTGTASCFLHPTEASHGDLGILKENDALILFSNSGETAELSPLIQYAHRYKIPLIAMTAFPKSTLAQASQWILELPQEPEVCPLGLAPTTSSLLMLGLGDALAVALLQIKNFQRSDYHDRHPAGSLGLKMMRVEHIMRKTTQLPLALPSTLMSEALVTMTEKACGCLGVVSSLTDSMRKLVGIVTDGDLRRHMSSTLLSFPVEQVMTYAPLTIPEDTLVSDALTLMNEHKITVLFVHDMGENVTGLVHLHDCLKIKIY